MLGVTLNTDHLYIASSAYTLTISFKWNAFTGLFSRLIKYDTLASEFKLAIKSQLQKPLLPNS